MQILIIRVFPQSQPLLNLFVEVPLFVLKVFAMSQESGQPGRRMANIGFRKQDNPG